jgi:GNAT superfamily N-acetyltransferase
LSPAEYGGAREILEALDVHLVVDAILDGRTEGQVYVDDRARPGAALVRRSQRFYLAAEQPEAGAALLSHWSTVLYPQTLADGHSMYVLYLATDAWAPLVEEVLAPRTPIAAPRQVWMTSTTNPAPLPSLPDGYEVVAIDHTFCTSNLLHLDALNEEIGDEHPSLAAFLESSFGVCVIYEGREIAGWCLAEYPDPRRCEVGIETLFSHRRRGLGTAMTRALVKQARARGLAQVGWHSYTRNVPSIATARKAGLHKVCDHPAYIGHFDPVVHLADHGYNAVGQGRLEEGLAWLEQAFAAGDAPGWAYYTAGCACATLGRPDRALAYLGRAVEQGFSAREIYAGDERLRALRGRAGWAGLLARLDP